MIAIGAASVLGGSDCEAIADGLLAQPVNAVSSLAYVVAGVAIVARRSLAGHRRTVITGWLVIGVGVSSILYHGPGPSGVAFVHDAAIAALLGWLAAWRHPTLAGPGVVAVVGAVATADAVAPDSGGLILVAVGAVAAIAVAVAVVERDPPPGRLVAIGALLAAAAPCAVLGRTGGPWCQPGSLLQPHAAWHVLTAAAVWLVTTMLPAGGRAVRTG